MWPWPAPSSCTTVCARWVASSRDRSGNSETMIVVTEVLDRASKSTLCSEIIAELPMSFGRPDANARYVRDIADRSVFAASVEGDVLGLIALEVQFASTCNIWWLGVRPLAHRRGLGRALIGKSIDFARASGCRRVAVETMSPRDDSAEYAVAR